MVNVRLCETARLALFFAGTRHFEFLDKNLRDPGFKGFFVFERKTFRLLKCKPQIWLRVMRMS